LAFSFHNRDVADRAIENHCWWFDLSLRRHRRWLRMGWWLPTQNYNTRKEEAAFRAFGSNSAGLGRIGAPTRDFPGCSLYFAHNRQVFFNKKIGGILVDFEEKPPSPSSAPSFS
jgi:hypothetical protein